MMNYIMKTRMILPALLLLYLTACNEKWDEHYSTNPDIVVKENLWEIISSRSDLTEFAAILQKTGKDKMLSNSQMYTVWAPKNGSFDVSELNEETLVDYFINNHICRSVQSIPNNADTTFNKTLKMLNKKLLSFYATDGKVYLNEKAIIEENILSQNGLLHILDGRASYFYNIWEYLPNDTSLSTLCSYFYSFDSLVFDAESSIEGGVINGEIYYIDSVVYNYNEIFYTLGYLSKEDFSYEFLAPTNKAWNLAYEKAKPYFNYGVRPSADILQHHYTQAAIVQNTTFNMLYQDAPEDSLSSTNGTTFYYPYQKDSLLGGCVSLKMSNGILHKCDSLRIRPTESWYLPIVVEAESPTGREGLYCSMENRTAANPAYDVSRNRYLEVSPTSTTNPTVQFEIPNTLSAKYDIYCVFVPQKANNASAKNLLPTKVRFQISYINANGKGASSNFNAVTNNPEKVDTICIKKGFTFPCADYGLTPSVSLKVIGNVSNKETASYTRKMLIDCIYFKPVE